MNMIKKTLLLIIVLFFGFFVSANTSYALNQKGEGLLRKAGEKSGYSQGQGEVDQYTFAEQVGGIIQTVMSVLGIIFTVLMVYAGILWMTARGDEDQVSKSKDIISASVIGLIIAVGSYSITDFVVNNVFTETIQRSGGSKKNSKQKSKSGGSGFFSSKSCQNNDDCPKGKECFSGRCANKTNKNSVGDSCITYRDCSKGEVCNNGTCEKAP